MQVDCRAARSQRRTAVVLRRRARDGGAQKHDRGKGQHQRGAGRDTRNAATPSVPSRLSQYSTPNEETPGGTETIDTLSSKQRAHLRSLAHHLKPILHVGAEGVTDAVIESVREAFNTRELLKVKVHESAPVDVDDAATGIAAAIVGARVAQTIGRTVVLYRPFPDDPEIQLSA